MRKSNIVIGIILLFLSAFYYLSTRGFPSPTVTENLGAGFFPKLLSILLAFFALILILTSLFYRSEAGQEERAAISGGERLEEDSYSAEGISYKFLLGTIVFSILYVIFLPIIGYLIITPVYIIAIIRFLGKKKWFHNITVSILLTAALYLLFAMMLGVALPPGIFFR